VIRQYLDTVALKAERCQLEGEEARHLVSVLRIAVGSVVEGFDGCGCCRSFCVREVTKRYVELEPTTGLHEEPPPEFRLTLFACISKGSRMEWTIEKAVELGVWSIVPIISERTIVRLDAGEGVQRRERWLRVAREAARQCGSLWVPQIELPCQLTESAPLVKERGPTFMASLYEGAQPLRVTLKNVQQKISQVGWYVGPEGDFTPGEEEALRLAGAIPVSLGRLVLRTETAAIYGLSVLNNEFFV